MTSRTRLCEVVEGSVEHALALATRLRAQDVAEVRASCGLEPLPALELSVEVSKVVCRAMLFEGEVGALFGLAPTDHPLIGCAWLLGSDLIARHPSAFWRTSQREVLSLLEHRPVLTNWVDQRNETSLRWLERLGAHFGQAQPFGVEGRPFVPFVITRS